MYSQWDRFRLIHSGNAQPRSYQSCKKHEENHITDMHQKMKVELGVEPRLWESIYRSESHVLPLHHSTTDVVELFLNIYLYTLTDWDRGLPNIPTKYWSYISPPIFFFFLASLTQILYCNQTILYSDNDTRRRFPRWYMVINMACMVCSIIVYTWLKTNTTILPRVMQEIVGSYDEKLSRGYYWGLLWPVIIYLHYKVSELYWTIVGVVRGVLTHIPTPPKFSTYIYGYFPLLSPPPLPSPFLYFPPCPYLVVLWLANLQFMIVSNREHEECTMG